MYKFLKNIMVAGCILGLFFFLLIDTTGTSKAYKSQEKIAKPEPSSYISASTKPVVEVIFEEEEKEKKVWEEVPEVVKPVKENSGNLLAEKYSKLVSFSPQAANKKCDTGGYRIDEGYDVNENDRLDKKEIVSTKFICDDHSSKAKLSSITPKKKSNQYKVEVGEDKNENQILEAQEVE